MTELLVGTKKGLFVLDGDVGGGFEVTARAFPGQAVEYAMRDPRSGRYLASVTSWFYGGRIWVTDDPAGEWQEAEGVALPEDGDASLARIWVIAAGEADGVLYAGGDPGCLFESHDGGLTWALNRGLWDHPTRPDWTPGRRRALPAHDRPLARRPGAADGRDLRGRRLALRRPRCDLALLEQRHRARVPARGGAGRPGAALRPQRPPLAGAARAPVHAVPRRRLPLRRRGRELDRRRRRHRPALRLRLPDRRRPGRSRQRLRDPADRRRGPDDARAAPCASGRPATRARAGRRAATACPSSDAYLTVLREAFDSAGSGPGLELYFGATSGEVYGSGDAGASWAQVAAHLPPVHSVRTA